MFKGVLKKNSDGGLTTEGPVRARPGSGRGIFFLLGMALMGLLQAFFPVFHGSGLSNTRGADHSSRIDHPAIAASGQRKPWGEFEYTKLPLEEPRVHSQNGRATRRASLVFRPGLPPAGRGLVQQLGSHTGSEGGIARPTLLANCKQRLLCFSPSTCGFGDEPIRARAHLWRPR